MQISKCNAEHEWYQGQKSMIVPINIEEILY